MAGELMEKSDDVVLCVNSGSSSLKFALFTRAGSEPKAIATGAIERIGIGGGQAWLRRESDDGQKPTKEAGSFDDHAQALDAMLSMLEKAALPAPTRVGHRIVHGGSRFIAPCVIDDDVLDALRSLVPLAPLHMPSGIAGIEGIRKKRPNLMQIACFDTAFHAHMPDVARRLALPGRFVRAGVQRYGFHGLSCEHTMSVLGANAPARIVIAHLGNGASLTAVKNGVSIDTTMGFTPTGGIPMGTRTGDLDPGVVVYMMRHEKLSADALEHVVDRESGLGAIGGTPDVKTLLEHAPTDANARAAIETFTYAIRKTVGAFAAALGGLDLVVFTGGIGEHAPEVRSLACAGLEALGIRLDDARNRGGEDDISADDSGCAVKIIAADEALVIARHVLALCAERG